MTNQTAEDYISHLDDLAADFRKLARAGAAPSIYEVVDLLRIDENNRMIRDLCVELKIATKQEFDRAMRQRRVRDAIGTCPANAVQLAQAWCKAHDVSMKLDGMFTRSVSAYYEDDNGVRTPITKKDRDQSDDVNLYASFIFDRKERFNRLDFERELRIFTAEHRLGFCREDIADACEKWCANARDQRLYEIFGSIEGVDATFDADAAWLTFATHAFDCEDADPQFVAAVFKKFIWQVKRKMRGLPVTNHLMPVILGPQGIGKSTLVNAIMKPVEEIRLYADFGMITDERNVEIWSSYVLFLDEMSHAARADIETVKNVITASSLTRRPMRSNGKITIQQNATLIGCANKELAQLIKDPTGIRRFAGVRMRSDTDREYLNAIDWPAMWGSVAMYDADPMADFVDLLATQQEGQRERGRVEQWMADFDGTNHRYQATVSTTSRITANDLYLAYQDYEADFYPGNYKMSKTEWDYEMSRLRKNHPEAVCFVKKRGGAGVEYKWLQGLRLVDTGNMRQ